MRWLHGIACRVRGHRWVTDHSRSMLWSCKCGCRMWGSTVYLPHEQL